MLYLIDANVIITAKDKYYAIDRVPEYWEWLVHHADAGDIKMPLEILDEVKPGADKNHPFYVWRKDAATIDALVLAEEADPALVQRVLTEGYGEHLTDDELITIGADPFLVAYALAGSDRVVVTTEVSALTKKRQNRKLPDICVHFGVRSIDTFQMNTELDFKTNWRK